MHRDRRARDRLRTIAKLIRERSVTEAGADGQTAPPLDTLGATGERTYTSSSMTSAATPSAATTSRSVCAAASPG